MIHWLRASSALYASFLAIAPTTLWTFQFSGGLSIGGIQIGAAPLLAVSPFAGAHWRNDQGFLLELHNMFSVLPGRYLGVHDRISATAGYDWKHGVISLGPSLSLYSMVVCGAVICRRVEGLAPGAHSQIEWYFAEPLGVAVSANVAWYGGKSVVLPGNGALMVTAGPVLKWEAK